MHKKQQMWVWSLGQEDPLEKEMTTHSSIPAWKIPWIEEPSWLQFVGSQRVGHDWAHTLRCSFAQSGPTLCNPMTAAHQTSVPHHLPKFGQVHVHCISDVIQPSHPLMPSSPSAPSISQHQGLFQWVSCSHQMTKILEFQLQHQSFQQVFRIYFL